jgi:hypothetical protein
MLSPRTRLIICFSVVFIIGIPTLLLGAYGQWNYPIFYGLPLSLWICLLAIGAILSIALLFLCTGSRRSAIVVLLFTALWGLILLPETQYYLRTRNAAENSIVKPFYRDQYLVGYTFALLPTPFVLFGFWLRSRRRKILLYALGLLVAIAIGTFAAPRVRDALLVTALSDPEKKVIGVWTWTTIDAVGRLRISPNHRFDMWFIESKRDENHPDPRYVTHGNWRIEAAEFVYLQDPGQFPEELRDWKPPHIPLSDFGTSMTKGH